MTSASRKRIVRPRLADWPGWSYPDYLAYFLSLAGMQARLAGETSPAQHMTADEFQAFCRPIRERFTQLFDAPRPRVSIVIPAYNEEGELLPTLLALTRLDVSAGTVEVVVADNNSTDHTAAVIKNCGAKYTLCTTPGIGYCRLAGYQAISPAAEYLWLTDSDTRVIPPLRRIGDLDRTSTLMTTCCRFLDENPEMLGLSTGALPEGGHWLYRLVRRVRVRLGMSLRYSCWAGYNQFIRRSALEAIGGIDPTIESGEDHYRHVQLARLGKRLHKGLSSANMDARLADPVYYSGRRYANLKLLLRHYREALFRPAPQRDEYGFARHDPGVAWRQIRLGEK